MNKAKSEEIKTAQALVKKLLEEHPMTRDSDNYLLVKFWTQELRYNGKDPYHIPAYEIWDAMTDKRLTAAETIVRARRIIQAAHPELWGNKRRLRKCAAVDVKDNINR